METIDVQIKTDLSVYPILKKEWNFDTNLNNALTETVYEQVVLQKC